MATQYANGKIVTSGLVLALDAADRNSYVSGSTVWRDVSGNGNNSTSSTPLYSGSFGGSLYFPNNTTAPFFSPLFTLIPNGGLTLETFAYITSASLYEPAADVHGIFGFRSGSTISACAVDQGLGGSSITRGAQYAWQNPSTPFGGKYYAGNSSYPNIDSWYHTVWIQADPFLYCYVNGIIYYSSNVGLTSQTFNSVQAQIGRGIGGGNFALLGNIAIARAYNRPLSQQEILQNYNAQKSRFNL
jgi:hypothetical protein